jgi:hypothetical protein
MKTSKLRTLTFIGLSSIAATLVLVADSDPLRLRIRDKCDPATFNATLGSDTCVGDGNVTFQQFLAEVTKDHKADAWRFNPDEQEVDSGTTLQLESQGGETHTFTKVKDFGGGIVPLLNTLSGNPTVAPECLVNANPFPDPTSAAFSALVQPGKQVTGPTAGSNAMPKGRQATKYQCCIHPWMRAELTAK